MTTEKHGVSLKGSGVALCLCEKDLGGLRSLSWRVKWLLAIHMGFQKYSYRGQCNSARLWDMKVSAQRWFCNRSRSYCLQYRKYRGSREKTGNKCQKLCGKFFLSPDMWNYKFRIGFAPGRNLFDNAALKIITISCVFFFLNGIKQKNIYPNSYIGIGETFNSVRSNEYAC